MRASRLFTVCLAACCLLAFTAAGQNSKPNIYIIATGGTIAGSGNSAVESSYSAGQVSIGRLLEAVPQIQEIARVTGEQFVNIGSQDMDDALLLRLAQKVNALLQQEHVDGIVITHGTDTMEETAYFLTLTTHSNKPVVLTGAMRPSTAMSADGPLNLYNAVVVASDTASYGKGVLVAMNEKIFDAKNVTKTNTTAVETFASPNTGAIGTLHNGHAGYTQQPLYRHTSQSEFDITGLDQLPKVGIAYGYVNADSVTVQAFVKNGYEGIIYAGVGNGNIHKNILPILVQARRNGIAVVRSSRVPAGETTSFAEVDDDTPGFTAARRLNPQKARILLQLALTVTRDPKDLKRIFNEY